MCYDGNVYGKRKNVMGGVIETTNQHLEFVAIFQQRREGIFGVS